MSFASSRYIPLVTERDKSQLKAINILLLRSTEPRSGGAIYHLNLTQAHRSPLERKIFEKRISIDMLLLRSKSPSLVAQRHQRIDFRRAPRRNKAGEERHRNQQCRHHPKRDRILLRHAKQQRRHHSRQSKRTTQTQNYAHTILLIGHTPTALTQHP